MSRTCLASSLFCWFALLVSACPETRENPDSGQGATADPADAGTVPTSDNQVGSEAGASSTGSGGTRAAAGSGGRAGAPSGGPAGASAGAGGSSGSQAGQSGSASSDDANAEAKSCAVGGCSNQLCTDAASGPVISTCEWTEAYGCYRSATCERQSGGQCGWRQTPELMQCLKEAGQP